MTAVDAAVLIARLLQFAAVAVVGGSSAFFLYGVAPDPRALWPIRLVRLAAALGALGTLGGLAAQAGQIGDTTVWSVATETGFGRAALVRLGLFLVAFVVTLGRPSWLILAGLGLAASASFAWTGHGVRDEAPAGLFHLGADVLHLLAASVWIGALAALAILLLQATRSVDAGRDAHTGLVRFSGIGLAVVAVLVASGLVNSWFLVGPDGVGQLPTSPYGQVLVAKLALFGLMLALAAANRYRHTPRLERAANDEAGPSRFRPLLICVLAETALALAVLALVSWLGSLSPLADG